MDLRNLVRPGHSQTVWQEIKDVQEERNRVVHRAQAVTPDRASEAVNIARYLLDEVFPRLVEAVGLGLLPTKEICAPYHTLAVKRQGSAS